MKLYILTFGLLAIFFSCGQPNEKKNITLDTTNLLQSNFDKNEIKRLEKRKQIGEKNNADSLRLDKILQDALKIANQNFGKNKFNQKYEVSTDNINVKVEINLNYHLTKASPHLIIRRNDPNAIYIDIYSKYDDTFLKVVSHEEWKLTYVNDTIRDVNGDGLNDFIVNWYGASGCCLKAFSNVYLLKQDKKAFSESFEFINPTFSPKEKIIRGVCYGHSGETEMYKYKWNGEKVDTLEFVSYERNKNGKTGKILISTDRPYGNKFKTMKILNSIPAEYKNIEGYDWFTGNGYK